MELLNACVGSRRIANVIRDGNEDTPFVDVLISATCELALQTYLKGVSVVFLKSISLLGRSLDRTL